MSPAHPAPRRIVRPFAHRRTVWSTAGLVLLSVGALTACGSDKDTSAETTVLVETTVIVETTVDKAAFIAAGNTLCDETKVALDKAFPDFGGEPTIEQVKKLGADLGPVFQTFRAGVADLAPPTDLAEGHQRLLDALSESIDTLASMAATDAGAQAALDAGGPPLDEPSNAAHAIFPNCPAGDS